MTLIRNGLAAVVAMMLLVTSSLLACGGDDGRARRGDQGEAGGSGGDVGAAGTGGAGGAAGAGGGGGDSAIGYVDPVSASGSRIRQRYLDAGGGAFQTVELWDTELQTSCTFGTAVDGALRCLPDRAGAVHFLDSDCTRPVVTANSSDCDLGWVRSNYDGTYYRRTETPAVMEERSFYGRDSTGCYAMTFAVDDGIWVAEKVPSATFVKGTRSDEVRAEGLVARFIDGEDGSRTLVEVVHGMRGYTCSYDGGRCVPAANAALRFLDAGCTEPVARVFGGGTPRQISIGNYDARSCPVSASHYETGGRVEPTAVFYRSGADCLPDRLDSAYSYFRLGAAIPADALPRASLVHEGDGRLAARRYVDLDGAPLGRAHTFWDTDLDEECNAAELEDGTFACVPVERGWSVYSYFADPLCEERYRVFTTYCIDPPRVVGATADFGCKAVRGVHRLSSVFERGASLSEYHYGNTHVACEPRSFSPPEFGYLPGVDVTDSLPRLELHLE